MSLACLALAGMMANAYRLCIMMRPALLIFTAVALGACDARSNLEDFEYPASTAYDSKDWPELAPTKDLLANVPTLTAADTASLDTLAARASALKARASGLTVPRFDTSRISRLKRRAAALRAAQI